MSGSKNNRVYTYFDTKNLEAALREASSDALASGAIKIRNRARNSLKPAPKQDDLESLIDFIPEPLRSILAKQTDLRGIDIFGMAREIGIPAKAVRQALNILTDARKSMRKKKGVPSAPGRPPHSQTGTLRKNIVASQDKKTGNVRVGLSADGWYGRVHEFGGRKHPKRPFLKPALDKETPHLPNEFRYVDLAATQAGKKLNRRKAPFNVD